MTFEGTITLYDSMDKVIDERRYHSIQQRKTILSAWGRIYEYQYAYYQILPTVHVTYHEMKKFNIPRGFNN